MTSIKCTQEHTDELLVLDNAKQLHILINNSDKSIPLPCLFEDAHDLPRAFKDVNGSCLTVETTTSKVCRFDFGKWPIDAIVKSCTNLISSLCTNQEKTDFARSMFKHFTPQNRGLEALISTLAEFLQCDFGKSSAVVTSDGWSRLANTKAHQRALRSSNIFAVPPESVKENQKLADSSDLTPYPQALRHVLLAVHLVAEDALLDTTTRFKNLAKLAPILGWLSKAARRDDYVGWWQRWAGDYIPLAFDSGKCG